MGMPLSFSKHKDTSSHNKINYSVYYSEHTNNHIPA